MKKLYIQPSIEFEAIETADILKSSWEVNSGDFTGDNDSDSPSGSLEGGGSDEFGDAKQSTFIWDDEF